MMSRATFVVILLFCVLPVILAQRSGGGGGGGSSYHYSSTSYSSSGGGSCSTGCAVGLGSAAAFIVIVGILFCVCKHCNGGAGAGAGGGRQQQINQQYLQTPAAVSYGPKATRSTTFSLHPTSGTWRGAYQGHSRLNAGSHIMSIELTFNGTRVEGYHGSDQVGTFTMEGDFRHDNHKIAMIKRYGWERPVRYQGVFTSNSSINGTWHTTNGDSGTWNLQCVTPALAIAQPLQPQPVYQATVANHHVIEMTQPTPTTPFGYSAPTAPPYSSPSPQLAPTPAPDVPVTPAPVALPNMNYAPEGIPPTYQQPTSAYTYIPTYGQSQPAT